MVPEALIDDSAEALVAAWNEVAAAAALIGGCLTSLHAQNPLYPYGGSMEDKPAGETLAMPLQDNWK